MKTQNQKSEKKVNVEKINVASIEERLSKIDVSKKERQSKERLYKNVNSSMSFEDQKKYRGKMRRHLSKIKNEILIFTKTKNEEKKKEAIKNFISFYKKEFVKNDLSIESITNSKNEIEKEELILMLDIIKKSKTKID